MCDNKKAWLTPNGNGDVAKFSKKCFTKTTVIRLTPFLHIGFGCKMRLIRVIIFEHGGIFVGTY